MTRALAVIALLGACGAGARATTEPAPTGFAVPEDVGALVVDEREFAAAARGWRAGLAVSAADDETRKQQTFVLAVLDALDRRWPEALAGVDRVAAMEVDPAEKAMVGLTIRVWADAIAHEGDHAEGFRAAFERQLAALPLEKVRQHLSMLRTMSQVFTPDVCRQLVTQEVGPRAKGGRISLADVHILAFQRYAVARLVPVARLIDGALAARGIEPVRQ